MITPRTALCFLIIIYSSFGCQQQQNNNDDAGLSTDDEHVNLQAQADLYRSKGLVNEETRVLRRIYELYNYEKESRPEQESDLYLYDAVIACVRLSLIYDSQKSPDMSQEWFNNAMVLMLSIHADEKTATEGLNALRSWVRRESGALGTAAGSD